MKRRDNLTELRAKDTKSLADLIRSHEQRLLELRFEAAFRKLKNVHEIRLTRRQLARLTTILREKIQVNLSPSTKES